MREKCCCSDERAWWDSIRRNFSNFLRKIYYIFHSTFFFVEIQSKSVASSGLLFSRKGPKFISNKFIVDNGETAQYLFTMISPSAKVLAMKL